MQNEFEINSMEIYDQEILSASEYTKQCVSEAENSRQEYLELKNKVDYVLFLLQVDL